MRTNTLILVILLAVLAAPAVAEVLVTPGNNPRLVINARNGQIWTPVRNVPEENFLNPQGDLRGDGAPSGAVNPATQMPEVAWSRNDEGLFEVVFSHWDGTAWTPFETVGQGGGSHLTPRLFHDGDGSRYVFWTVWQNGKTLALVSAATATGAFSTPKSLDDIALEGRYPSAHVLVESIWTVHEKREQGVRYIVLQQFGLIEPCGPTGFVPRINEIDNPWEKAQVLLEPEKLQLPSGSGTVSGAPGGQITPPQPVYPPSDPRVHEEDGVIWADWYQGELGLGYAVWNGVDLDGPYFVELDGQTTIETARRDVRRSVTGNR
jgi:hypothetical protein